MESQPPEITHLFFGQALKKLIEVIGQYWQNVSLLGQPAV
jgi:hypothetical protein